MKQKFRPPVARSLRVLVGIILLGLYLPVILLCFRSFREVTAGGEVIWTLKWFYEVFADPELLDATIRSLLIATGSALLATILGTFAAISLVKSDFPGKEFLQRLSFTSLVLPEIVFALAFLGWFMILKFELGSTTVIISHTTFCLAYVITTVSGRLKSFDSAIDDAARDLGATPRQVVTQITLPMLKPALWSSFILSFMLSFDDFLITFFVNSVGNDTLPVKLYGAIKFGVTPKINALSTMLFLVSTAVLGLVYGANFWGGVKIKRRFFQ